MLRSTTIVALLLLPSLPAQRHRNAGPAPKLEHGTFTTGSFESEAMGGRTPYGVYLPKGYDDKANADRRYPLVVYLHGMFEDHERFHDRGGTAVLDGMIGAGTFPETVFVTVEGGRSSFYINAGKGRRVEDMITHDLLAYVEKHYRVQPGREHRALLGVSMGGYGALKIALHHPDLFGAVAAHSAALLPRDPAELDERFPWLKRWGGGQRVLGQIFGNPIDLKRWRRENVLSMADDLDPAKLDGLKIYLDCGDQDRYGFDAPNLELHEILTKKKIPHTWRLVKGGNHGWRSQYNQRALPHSLAFIASYWAAAKGASGLGGLLRGGLGRPHKGGDAP